MNAITMHWKYKRSIGLNGHLGFTQNLILEELHMMLLGQLVHLSDPEN